MTTTFRGELRGDRISGTFTSHGMGAGEAAGTWSVTRRPSRTAAQEE